MGQNGWNGEGNEMAEMPARFRKDITTSQYLIRFNADVDVDMDAGLYLVSIAHCTVNTHYTHTRNISV